MITPDALTKARAALTGGGLKAGPMRPAAKPTGTVMAGGKMGPTPTFVPTPAKGGGDDALLSALMQADGGKGGASASLAGNPATNPAAAPPMRRPVAPPPPGQMAYSPYGEGDPRQGLAMPPPPGQRAPIQPTRSLGELAPPPPAPGAALVNQAIGPRPGQAVNQSGRRFGNGGRVLY